VASGRRKRRYLAVATDTSMAFVLVTNMPHARDDIPAFAGEMC